MSCQCVPPPPWDWEAQKLSQRKFSDRLIPLAASLVPGEHKKPERTPLEVALWVPTFPYPLRGFYFDCDPLGGVHGERMCPGIFLG